jgi:hypothetical protein
VNIDESSFNTTYNQSKGWIKKGELQKNTVKQAFTTITLVAALQDSGVCHYSFVQGSHNNVSWGIYLEELSDSLDKQDPEWRKKKMLLVDNHSMHHHESVLNVIR